MCRLKTRIFFSLAGVLTLFFFTIGCQKVNYKPADEAKFLKPTIAVMSFENRAPVHTKWHLGQALSDQLIDRLMATRRYIVLERAQLHAVMRELQRTEDAEFRQVGQPQRGQLKHVKYLIKGTITDFGHVENIEGIFQPIVSLFGSTSHAVVSATIYVIDVQNGQVIASSSVEEKIRDKKAQGKVSFDDMAFGSYTFYHTPLGRATNKMLDKAVRSIARIIAEQSYQPKIASVLNDQVIVNGGKDRKLRVGDEFAVRPASQGVLDPDTGDLLGHVTGSIIGYVRIVQVTGKFSIAKVVTGDQFEPGQTLFSVKYDKDDLIVDTPAETASY